MRCILSTPRGDIDLHDITNGMVIDGSWDTSTVGELHFTWLARGTDTASVALNAGRVQQAIDEAPTARTLQDAVTLITDVMDTGYPVTFDLTGGTITPTADGRYSSATVYDVVLTCLEDGRSEPYDVTVSGTLSGTTAKILVPGIPGTAPALAHLELTDTSASGIVNRVRVATAPRNQTYSAISDFVAWHDATIAGSATNTVDATALGGGYAALTTSSNVWQDVATITPPASALYRGRRDGYLRVKGSGTAIGTPASLAGTVNAATKSSSTTVTTTPDVAVATSTVATSGTPTQQSATGTGSATATTSFASSLVGDYFFVVGVTASGSVTQSSVAATNVTLVSWQQDVGIGYGLFRCSTAGTVTFTSPGTAVTARVHAVRMRFTGQRATDGTEVYTLGSAISTSQVGSASISTPDPTPEPGDLAVFVMGSSTSTLNASFWTAGFTEWFDENNMVGATLRVSAQGESVSSTAVFDQPLVNGGFLFLIRPTTTVTPGSTIVDTQITFVEPTPGELPVDTYTTRVQGIDAAGYRSNATASLSKTTTVERSNVAWSCATLTNAVAYAWTIQAVSTSKYYEVITSGPAFTLTTLDGLGQVSALPATTGATAPPPLIRARIGTTGDSVYSDITEIIADSSNTWQLQRLFADRPTPPTDAMLTEWTDTRIVIQTASANGASSTTNVDGLWLVPSREPQVTVEVPGMAETTKRRFVIESARDGRGTIAKRENTATGAEAGRLNTFGALALPPGDSLLLLEFEQAAGVQVQAASVTATLTIWPRHKIEFGGA
jgi:hypothetical protein